MSTQQFYDDLAVYYDLIFENWEASMARQGAAISGLIERELGIEAAPAAPAALHVLDASSGIGTQALPLAARRYRVTARDLSPAAIDRLRHEAVARGLDVSPAVADMRALKTTVTGPFDVVLSFDNSLPHLLSDTELFTALQQFWEVLRPGGLFLCSVRDYDLVTREKPSSHPYGERSRDGTRYRLHQDWVWDGPMYYDATMVVEREVAGDWTVVLRSTMRYYAVPIPRLLALMQEAGFVQVRRDDTVLYQPVLVAHRAA